MDGEQGRRSLTDHRTWLDYQELPAKVITANQLVAYNITYWRNAKGMTQDELGVLLEAFTGRPWSKATVSAAERSWDGKRIRQFDADELLALAEALEVPLAGLFLPPVDDGVEARYGIVTGSGRRGEEGLSVRDLISYLVPDVSDEEEGNLAEFGRRLESAVDFHFGHGIMRDINRYTAGRSDQLQARLEMLREQREALRSLMGDIEREAAQIQEEIASSGMRPGEDRERERQLDKIRAELRAAVNSIEDAVLLKRLMFASFLVLDDGPDRHEARALVTELAQILESMPRPMHEELAQVVRDAIAKASDYRTPWLKLTSFCREYLEGGLEHDLAVRVGARISAGEDPAAVAEEIGLPSSILRIILSKNRVSVPETVKWPADPWAANQKAD